MLIDLFKDVSEALVQSQDRKRTASFDRILSPIFDAREEKTTPKGISRTLTDKTSSINLDQTGNIDDWRNELPQLCMVAVSDVIGEIVHLDKEVIIHFFCDLLFAICDL